MHHQKAKDAERIRFIAPPGSATLYTEVAALEQIPVDAWMSRALHAQAARVLEAHGRDTARMPLLSASNVVTLTDAIELSVGLQHTCALRSTGRVVCWGDNTKGQLGDGSALDRSIPVSVVGVDSADEVAAGGTHTCLRRGGEVLCWGEGASGQLGDGGMVDRSVPVLVAGLSDAVEISSGGFQGA